MQVFMQYVKPFIDVLVNNLLIPIVLIVIPVVLNKIDKYFKRISASTEDKNNQDALLSVGNLLTETLKQIEQIVSGAVASNMNVAEKFKEEFGGKLSDEMADNLKETAFEVSYALLPNNITEGPVFEMLGGKEGIRKLIYNFIDKQVILLKESKNKPAFTEVATLTAPVQLGEAVVGTTESTESTPAEEFVSEPNPNEEDVSEDLEPISGNATLNNRSTAATGNDRLNKDLE